jgi:uncharacterized protein (TIGR02246 family)
MTRDFHSSEIEDLSAELVSRFDAAWNERDADGLAALFSEDADFQFYYGHLVRGREKIRKYYQDKVFPYLEEGLRHVTRKYQVRVLTEGAILGTGRVDLVEVDGEGREVRVQRRVRVTTVVVREGDEWKFAAVRVMVPVK